MAVIHPQDRFTRTRDDLREGRRPLHPAVGLALGFGFIVAVATMVHIIFNAVM